MSFVSFLLLVFLAKNAVGETKTAEGSSSAISTQAIAEALFQEGRDQLAQGKTAEACSKFAESYRIDPATGTLLNLAACNEALGKFATAWSEFRRALGAAQRDGRLDRVSYAAERIRVLEGKLSRIFIRVAEQSRRDSVEVRMDGVVVGRAGWEIAIPVDPGKHIIEAMVKGGTPWTQVVEVGIHANVVEVEIPAWEAKQQSDSEVRPTGYVRMRRIVYLSGGLGVAALVATGAFGWHATRKWDDATLDCPTRQDCSQKAIDAQRAAKRAATRADICVGIGLAALVTATYLWIRWPETEKLHSHTQGRLQVVPDVSPGRVSLSMQGGW